MRHTRSRDSCAWEIKHLPTDSFVDLLTAQGCKGHLFQLVKIRYTPGARELPIAAMTSFRILEKN